MVINGFIVVRLPHLNYLVPGRDVIPCVNGIYYAGVDRQRWADIFDEDFYAKKASAEIIHMASLLKSESNDFTGLNLCQNLEIASRLLAHSNRKSISNELIAVRSPSLEATKGTIATDLKIEWIGFDFVALGEWSLIAGGMFMYPDNYSAWLARSNCFGLFDDSSLLTEYALAYEKSVQAGRSEPLAPQTAARETIIIEVGRVL